MLCFEGCFVGVRGEDATWLWPFTILDPCVCEGGLSSFHLLLSSDGMSSMEGRGEKRLLGGNWVSLKTASRTAGVV